MINFNTVENRLAKDDERNYTAVVQHQETLTVRDIAEALFATRSENDARTMADIFEKMEEVIIAKLKDGYMVDTALFHARTTITGVFEGPNSNFDPTRGHAVSLVLDPCPPAKGRITDVVCTNRGPLPVGPRIDTVTDIRTHTQMGTQTRSLITPTKNLRVKGKNLRVAWDDQPGHATTCGIFLIADTTQARIRIPDADIATNTPTELLFQLPSLVPGTYWLEIVTQSSGSNNKQLVKDPRTVRFDIPLIVEQE